MKKFLLIILGALLLSLAWFLFIKKYDYQFRFKVNHSPAMVQQELKNLETFKIFQSEPEVVNEDVIQYSELQQRLKFNEKSLDVLWELDKESDSTTNVTVNVLSEDKLKNRLSLLNPFSKSDYIDSLERSFVKLGKNLLIKQSTYKVQVVDSIVFSPDFDCICRPAENIKIENKAMQMVKDINYLEDFVEAYRLKLTGYPFVKINKWDEKENLISFDFCFPVNLAQDIRPNSFVEFQQFPGVRSLKAIYNGNYKTSSLAWYELLEEAKSRNIEASKLPVEVFWNNPREGGDALKWKAEIYMPISPED